MDGCLQSGTRRSSAQATAPHAWAFRLCRLPSHTRSSVFPHTLGLPCLSPLTPGGRVRMPSPLPQITGRFPTFGELAGSARPECSGQASPREGRLRDHGVSPAR